jgi:hypothetical protein
VVTGPPNSGKSTFVKNASGEKTTADTKGRDSEPTTIAVDFEMLTEKGFDITLCETPEQPRLDQLIPKKLRHTMGIVLMLDATNPSSLPPVKEMICLLTRRSVPFVIAANKKDLPGSLEAYEIRKALEMKADVPLFFISATRKADVRRVIESLVDSVAQF